MPLNFRVACGTASSEGHVVPTPRDKGKGKAPREDTPTVQIVPRPPFRFNRESLPEKQAIYKSPQLARPPAPPAPTVRMRGQVNPLRNPRRNTCRPLPPRHSVGAPELSVSRVMEEKNMVGEIAMFADRLFGAAVASFSDPAPVPSASVPSVPSPVLPTVTATSKLINPSLIVPPWPITFLVILCVTPMAPQPEFYNNHMIYFMGFLPYIKHPTYITSGWSGANCMVY